MYLCSCSFLLGLYALLSLCRQRCRRLCYSLRRTVLICHDVSVSIGPQCHNAEQLYVWLLHFIANNYLIFSHKPDFLELSGQCVSF